MGDHETSKINHADHLLLDQPLLRLPYELLRKNFRSAHFAVEKDSTAVKNLLRETANGALRGGTGPDDVLKNLDAMLARMRGVKRKLSQFADEEGRLYSQANARVAHLAELSPMHTLDDVKYEAWSRRRLDRLLVDYMLRHGYIRSAEALADSRGIQDLVDINTFVQMEKVLDSLIGGSVTEALAWCSDNKKELRKMDSNLEFMLRYQQYIELVRAQSAPKLLEAITHAKKYLIPFRDTYPVEVQQAAGLLAFRPPDDADEGAGTGGRPFYAELYSANRWVMLAELFTATHHALLSLPSSPLLHIALSAGLSALKTPACHSAHQPSSTALPLTSAPTTATSSFTTTTSAATNPASTTTSGAPRESPIAAHAAAGGSICPICSTELNELARAVPYAHHSKSYVEHDLVLLPNGRAYGRARLEDHARKAGFPPDQVRDLRTGEVYQTADLVKVFIT